MSKAEALCKLARECLQIDENTQAREFYEKAIAADIDCLEAHDGLADMSIKDGNYSTAAIHLSKLTLLQPMEPTHYTNLGAVYNHTGEFTQSVEVLRKAIQRDKRCAEAYYNLGIAQGKLKQTQMAVSAYREAARLNPKMVEAYQNLANVYMETMNLPMAITNYKKALEIKPDFEKALRGLAKAEALASSAKETANPFGRLVDAQSYQVNAEAIVARELTDAERYDDRHEVKHLAEEIERLAKGGLEFLKQKMEPAIIELQRTMAEGENAQVSLADVADQYQSVINQWSELRKALKRKTLELRAHEEIVNSPEVNL